MASASEACSVYRVREHEIEGAAPVPAIRLGGRLPNASFCYERSNHRERSERP